jgi:hypothetical protein
MTAIVNPLDTLSKDTRPWYKVGHLIKLNYIVLSLVMFCKFQLTMPSTNRRIFC